MLKCKKCGHTEYGLREKGTATDLNAKRFVSFKRQTIKFLKQKANKLSRKKLKADMIEEVQG